MKKFIGKITALAVAAMLTLTACGENNAAGSGIPKATVQLTGSAEGTAFGSGITNTEGNVGDVTLKSGDTYAVISVRDHGDITVKLFPELVPDGVNQFINLANDGYYDGKNFHRIMSGFMIQGGSLTGDGASGLPSGYSEFAVERNYKLRHFYGALCYANAGGRNGAQFYIVNNSDPQAYPYSELGLSNLEGNLAQAKAMVEQAKAMGEGYEMYVDYYQAQVDMFQGMIDYSNNTTEEINKLYATVGGTPSLDGGYTVFGQTVSGFEVIDSISSVEVVANPNNPDEVSHPVGDVIIESVKVYTKE